MNFGSKYVYYYNHSDSESVSAGSDSCEDSSSDSEPYPVVASAGFGSSFMQKLSSPFRKGKKSRSKKGVDPGFHTDGGPPMLQHDGAPMAGQGGPRRISTGAQLPDKKKKNKKKVRKADPNVFTVSVGKYVSAENAVSGQKTIRCGTCKAVLPSFSKFEVKEGTNNWLCEFCRSYNRDVDVEGWTKPTGDDITYELQPPVVVECKEKKLTDNSNIIFVIDISGSMGCTVDVDQVDSSGRRTRTFVSRLDAVKKAAEHQMRQIRDETPNVGVGLISFGSRMSERNAVEYVPGYDWIPGRFGPPPGIPRDIKQQFDRMSDKEYLYAASKLTNPEIMCLMVSEAERRRTFAAHWPIEAIVKANNCAKDGFYYTGIADQVRCAFCFLTVGNWERGDVPMLKHKGFLINCKTGPEGRSNNVPVSNSVMSGLQMTHQLSCAVGGDNGGPSNVSNASINDSKAKDPALSVFSKRKETYRRYPERNPVEADKLCDAGFLYEGIDDKVKCFWCDGALEMWSRGDDPWMEHAKFLKQTKGLDFNRQVRDQMSKEEVETAKSLVYNKDDVSFLDGQLEHVSVGAAAAQVDYYPAQAASTLNDLVVKAGELNEEEANVFVSKVVGCRSCHRPVMHNTVLQPCGDLCVCEQCGVEGRWPKKCPLCGMEVKGSVRIFLAQ